MLKKKKINHFLSFLLIGYMFLLTGRTISAKIYLHTGGLYHINTKTTTAVTLLREQIKLQDEKFSYPGFYGGIDFPVQSNSIGLSFSGGLLFGHQTIYLNKYNIQQYEYYINRLDGTIGRKINTEGVLEDKNFHELVEAYMNEHDKDFETNTADVIILTNVLLTYSFPVKIPLKHKVWKITSLILSYMNPYVAIGFSNVIFNRTLDLNNEIYNSIVAEHGADVKEECITSGSEQICETIEGVDNSPDPDFYLTFSAGMNITIPQLKLWGTQIVFTFEVLYHRNLSPDDMNKPFDDSYQYFQDALTFRFGTGIII